MRGVSSSRFSLCLSYVLLLYYFTFICVVHAACFSKLHLSNTILHRHEMLYNQSFLEWVRRVEAGVGQEQVKVK